jgi:hypothetical protein
MINISRKITVTVIFLILSILTLSLIFTKEITSSFDSFLPENSYFRKYIIHSIHYYEKNHHIDSLKSNASPIDTLKINLDNKTLLILDKERDNINKSFWSTGLQNIAKYPYYKSIIEYKDFKAISKLKHFGMNPDHWMHKNKTSYRLKFNGNKFFGKRKINLLSPKTRTYQLDHIFNQVYRHNYLGIGISYIPVVLSLNNESKGVYFMEDFFDKYLLAKNRKKESFIFESGFKGKFYGSSTVSQLDSEDSYFKINTIPKGDKWKGISKQVISLFQKDNSEELFEMIDSQKLNSIIGLCLISNRAHSLTDINLHWYYNPVNNKLEPTIRESMISLISKESTIDQLWKDLLDNLEVSPSLKLINAWINYQGVENAKQKIIQSSLNSALFIQEYQLTSEYKEFISQLNNEFSYKTKDIETIINNNIDHLIRNINSQPNSKLIYDSLVLNEDLFITEDLVVNEKMHLKIKPGVTVTLQNNANLYVYGKISAFGTNMNQVLLTAANNSNSSIYINSLAKSEFRYCEFTNLSALNNTLKLPLLKYVWETSSSITLFESRNIHFYNCIFTNNRIGDDLINVVSSDSIIFKNCSFNNIISDALDLDFSNALINNCLFNIIGNDAVDGSYSNINIIDCYFEEIDDKAISIGEESNVKLSNCEIKDSELALVVKDGSLLQSDNISFKNNKIDFLAFTKKKGYDSPSFILKNCNIKNYLIEKDVSNLGIGSYYRIDQKIEDVLYGNKFGKATVK